MMNNNTKFIQLLFVVETNKIVRSDNAYIVWLLQKSFAKYINEDQCNDIFITYDFVYMDGKTKYKAKRVIDDIRCGIKTFTFGKTYVVYCLDVDTTGKENKSLIDEIHEYTKANNYYLIISYPEIEDVMKIKIRGSKSDKVKYFLAHYPKKDFIGISSLTCPMEKVFGNIGSTNFNLVIEEIINLATKKYKR